MNQQLMVLVELLGLEAHPEGGYFGLNYCSDTTVQLDRFAYQERGSASHIYYGLDGEDYSAWHRLKSDEIWDYHLGTALTLYVITQGGQLQEILLGNPLENPGAQLSCVIKRDQWFAARVNQPKGYTLVSCIVTPAFDYGDWMLADSDDLIKAYPQHASIIRRYASQAKQPINN